MSVDQYNNFVISMSNGHVASFQNTAAFVLWLEENLKQAREKNCNAVLVRLYESAAGLVENFKDRSKFKVRGWIRDPNGGDYLELHYPLRSNSIPPYKTSRIGVLVVVSVQNKVFVVKERYGPPLFKFVTGAVESGEEPLDAAVREVREELGISVDKEKFALKALHLEKQARADVDDYCFVYYCKCDDQVVPNIQTDEILECKQVCITEFESDATLTAYTKSVLKSVIFGEETNPILRGKKQLTSFHFQ